MILALDVGNTQIFCGLFEQGELQLRFRKTSRDGLSSDELGVFFRSILREYDINPQQIKQVAVCSVVPDRMHAVANACRKYFDLEPFILQAGVKTGLKIAYRNPLEVGADRIANAIAAMHAFPDKNIIVVDFGTATTFDVITKDKEYAGGVIVPGLRLSMESLEANTAKLPTVEIIRPQHIVGRSTVESIQSGLYYGHLFTVRSMLNEIKQTVFNNDSTVCIGTGGFSSLFQEDNLFDDIQPDLVLLGLHQALQLNQ